MLHIYSTGKSSAERIQYEHTTADSEADSHYSTWILMLLHKSTIVVYCWCWFAQKVHYSLVLLNIHPDSSGVSFRVWEILAVITSTFSQKILISKWKSLKLAFCYLKWSTKRVFLWKPTHTFQLSMYYQIPDVSNQAVSNYAIQYKIRLRHKSSSISYR